ncbi:trehalase family glycosidase [Zhongshania aquimaris]|uniref:Alpha,alpha-trehalase n=1 Tax=Zhongshania aquimaris TaxID=2857107 RepID=A0ABS6VV79_9GAMM|nr:trehalase family glycosidase [Zhongshania aquimaris]MBW2942245.1 hypothetical protein [Zhongshania aquimaris]
MTLSQLLEFEWRVADKATLGVSGITAIEARVAHATRLRKSQRYPEIPSVNELHLPDSAPAKTVIPSLASPGLSSPLVEEARIIGLYDDYKPISDFTMRSVDENFTKHWARKFALVDSRGAERRRDVLKAYIDSAYGPEEPLSIAPNGLFKQRVTLQHSDILIVNAFDYVEAHWSKLCKLSSGVASGSLIPTPYPFLIPAGRFLESYYWDTGFSIDGLILTGRLELAQMQAENLLEQIRHFGFVPNGNRDYYLTRSQPPLSSRLVRSVVEATQRKAKESNDKLLSEKLRHWVSDRAVPLLAGEFDNFWSDENRRFDRSYGLHRHWDELDVERPERYGKDDEALLGKSLRDVRAMAESGLDFTEIFNGDSARNEITNFAPVLLNALLAGFASDVAWLSRFCGLAYEYERFTAIASARRSSIDRHLWDEKAGYYRSLNLSNKQFSPGVDFTTFAPLYVGVASKRQARLVAMSSSELLRHGGLASNTVRPTVHQWDGGNGWAPAQMMAVAGFLNYGYTEQAKDIANRWTRTLAEIFHRHGGFYERIDVEHCDLPESNRHQYPVQEGFLWTNASFVWMLNKVLGFELIHASDEIAAVVGFD